MKDLFAKLRMYGLVWRFRLKLFWSQITTPFLLIAKSIERYKLLRKIDKESENGWERHVKLAELKQKDELELRRSQFYLEKVQVICAFFKTSCCIEYRQMPEAHVQPDFMESAREEFIKNKDELIDAIRKLEEYEEVTFDEGIKFEILAWEFGQFKTEDELTDWSHRFSDYICALDII